MLALLIVVAMHCLLLGRPPGARKLQRAFKSGHGVGRGGARRKRAD
ncbi:hypothetical protein BRCON_2477 [Candidatus Sumerlaea chitinivorans]|uniref:Uncharacterized protein n=1 Tax=Sumerlaea chitinivorans TaxID=2250252 RepID=A0A2Z4Y7K9_SUMC1|nr:hypothetical protein BRCON_2477 [Candidatus Sumerlaea chitinivorans]